MTVVLLLNHRPWVDELLEVTHQQRGGHLETKDLQASRRRAGTTTHEGQVEKQQHGKAAPQGVVADRDPRGRDH
ncbi:hypothetical protein D3C72_2268160 [compost metagenome]